MELLRKLAQIPATRRRLLLRSWSRLLAASVAVRLLPASTVTRMCSDDKQARLLPSAERPSLDDICWCVEKAAAYLPGATCLAEAIVARRMLMESGYTAELHLGVQIGGERPFHAHAWVVSDGRIVAGESAAAGYMPLRRSVS